MLFFHAVMRRTTLNATAPSQAIKYTGAIVLFVTGSRIAGLDKWLDLAAKNRNPAGDHRHLGRTSHVREHGICQSSGSKPKTEEQIRPDGATVIGIGHDPEVVTDPVGDHNKRYR